MNMPHTRHSLRLRNYDYSQAGAYFFTICTHERVCLFGEIADSEMRLNALGEAAAECWAAIPEHFPDVELDADCVMPNHIHGIVVITQSAGATHASPLPNDRPAGPPSRSLGAIIGSFKSAATKRIHEIQCASNLAVWQRNYYERVIRNESELNNVRRYIANNPLRWAEDENNLARVRRSRELSGLGCKFLTWLLAHLKAPQHLCWRKPAVVKTY